LNRRYGRKSRSGAATYGRPFKGCSARAQYIHRSVHLLYRRSGESGGIGLFAARGAFACCLSNLQVYRSIRAGSRVPRLPVHRQGCGAVQRRPDATPVGAAEAWRHPFRGRGHLRSGVRTTGASSSCGQLQALPQIRCRPTTTATEGAPVGLPGLTGIISINDGTEDGVLGTHDESRVVQNSQLPDLLISPPFRTDVLTSPIQGPWTAQGEARVLKVRRSSLRRSVAGILRDYK